MATSRAPTDKYRDKANSLGCLLAFVLAVALGSAAYVSWRVATFDSMADTESFVPVESSSMTVSGPSLVKKDPLAVLVLDVSGSMQTSDPRFDQYEAVASFLKVYQHVAEGALADGVSPNVAVVLYSSIARPVAFGEDPWMPLRDDQDLDAILMFLAETLGSHDPALQHDPRIGWQTDHLAAAGVVDQITQRFRLAHPERGSCGIVFMTDGVYDPSPLTDASLTPSQRLDNRDRFWRTVAEAVQGELPLAGPKLESLQALLDESLQSASTPIRFGERPTERALYPLMTLRRRFDRELNNGKFLFDRSQHGVMGVEATSITSHAVRDQCGLAPQDYFAPVLLAPSNGAVQGWGEGVSAADLSFSFAGALARWLELDALSVHGGGFDVQPNSRALAVVVKSGAEPAAGRLVLGSHAYPLEQGICLLSDPPPGRWSIVTESSRELTVAAYSDRRYVWAVHRRPREYSILNQGDLALVLVGLHDTGGEAGVIPPGRVYSQIPDEQGFDFESASGFRGSGRMHWSESDNSYIIQIPEAIASTPGRLRIRAMIRGLVYENGLAAPVAEVSVDVPVVEAVDVGFFAGREVGKMSRIRSIEDAKLGRGDFLGSEKQRGGTID